MRGGKMLHIAPEATLADKFKQDYDYLSADLDGTIAMVGMDITDICYPDECFDAIVCNHVLEHIPDDHKALSELFRVLKPRGWGSIQVPMKGKETQEYPSISDSKERELVYGQSDHVRQYGKDFKYRLESVGFEVLEFSKSEILNPLELERISVACENQVLIVRKGAIVVE
jgi:ubiquinone/menaquinone biosynthesis C-methylase UbiE